MSKKEPFVTRVEADSESESRKISIRDKHELRSDEPDWLPGELGGNDDHPAPVDYLLASLSSCQVSVLQQCLEKHSVEPFEIECDAEIDGFEKAERLPELLPSNQALRVGHINIKMILTVSEADKNIADRCLTTYDEGCVVGQSLAGGIDYTTLVALETYK
jgi:uncharacterized OsmC-like protein